MEWLSTWAKNLVFYFVILSAVMNFLPGGEEKKLIRYYMGLLLLLFFMRPIFHVSDMEERLEKRINSYTRKEEYQETQKELKRLETKEREQFSSLLQKELEKRVVQTTEDQGYQVLACKVFLENETDRGADRLQLEIRLSKGEQDVESLKKNLANVYNFPLENINIRIQE